MTYGKGRTLPNITE